MKPRRIRYWQRRFDRLTVARLLRSMRVYRLRKVLFYLLVLLLIPVAIVLLIWLGGEYTSALNIGKACIYGLLFMLFAAAFGYEHLSAATDREDAPMFRKYGTPELVVERLKRGAEQILYETHNMLFTDHYILRKGDYASYLPYDAIAAYHIESGAVGALLFGGDPQASLVLRDTHGDDMTFLLTRKEHQHAEGFLMILQQRASGARAGYLAPYHGRKKRRGK